MRELRPNVWHLALTEGTTDDGKPIRRYHTIHGDENDAAAALRALAANVRHDLGDLRVRELLGRYVHANHPAPSPAFERDQITLHDIIEPAYGDRLAAHFTDADVGTALTRVYRQHGSDVTRAALGLTRDAYRWAHRQGWTDHDPTAGITLRTLR
jgi:hypothetical protein